MQTANFNGSWQITGSFEEPDAQKLADVINSGSLPLSLQLQSVQNVSPTLGKDSLHAAWISGLVGVGLVLLFMALYYRTLGLIVLLGLTVSGTLLWSIISLLSRTEGLALSLSGIAGIIVSVGVTVDSYVVFFERLKDEVKSGKTMRNSAQRGFTNAWRTIVVADLVSLIGALVLYLLAIGSVRGFAFFLGLSTLLDLILSYFVMHPLVSLMARRRALVTTRGVGIAAGLVYAVWHWRHEMAAWFVGLIAPRLSNAVTMFQRGGLGTPAGRLAGLGLVAPRVSPFAAMMRMPLTPTAYADLFAPIRPRLFSDDALFAWWPSACFFWFRLVFCGSAWFVFGSAWFFLVPHVCVWFRLVFLVPTIYFWFRLFFF